MRLRVVQGHDGERMTCALMLISLCWQVAIRFVRDTNAMVTTELVAHGHARDLDSYVQVHPKAADCDSARIVFDISFHLVILRPDLRQCRHRVHHMIPRLMRVSGL